MLVDGGVLTGETDHAAYRLGLVGDVEAQDAGVAAVGLEDGRQDAHGRCLAGAVRTQQPEHGSGRHRQVDPVERHDRTKALCQALDLDGRAVAEGVL